MATEKKVWEGDDIKLIRYFVRTKTGEVYRVGHCYFTQWRDSRYYLRRLTTSVGEVAKNNGLTLYGFTQTQLIRHLNNVEYHLPTTEIFNCVSDEEEGLVAELLNAVIERGLASLISRGGIHRNRRYESKQDALDSYSHWLEKVESIEYGLWQEYQITRESNPEIFHWPQSECN